jgi:uncharacterized protein (TIGR02266 family)
MSSEQKRKSVRVARPLEIHYAADCPPIAARVTDLSEGGAFVDTAAPMAPGTVVDFRLALPDGRPEGAVTGRARVIWSQPTVGMGFAFEGLDDEQRKRIRFYVASVFFGQSAPGN